MRPILVTGGTETLGRLVVRRLLARELAVRVLSRRPPGPGAPPGVDWTIGDLRTGAGLHEAVRDVAAIVHCATDVVRPGRVDVAGSRRLVTAAKDGEPHLVYVSIVGVDRVPLRYYKRKRQVERMVAESGLPWSIVRSTQFHDLLARACRVVAAAPLMVVPAGVSFQPIDAGEVADRLAGLATSSPTGQITCLGGPRVEPAATLARTYLRATGRRRLVLPVRVLGATFRGYRSGGHLAPEDAVGRLDFAAFVTGRGRAG